MTFKVVLMICCGLSMGFRLSSEVDTLVQIMEAMDGKLTYSIHEASITIRAYSVPVRYYADEAEYQYIVNLTKNAQVYWTFIEDAEAKAVEEGKNIDACVAAGNTEVYALNNSYVLNANKNIEQLVNATDNKIEDYYVPARDEPLQRLTELWLQVRACDNDECAADLENLINDTYEELEANINNAVTAVEQLVLVDYVSDLALFNFEANLYLPALNKIVAEVTACIDGV